jgi:hypothetical protein
MEGPIVAATRRGVAESAGRVATCGGAGLGATGGGAGAGALGGGANSFSFLFHTLIQLSFMEWSPKGIQIVAPESRTNRNIHTPGRPDFSF